MAFSIHGDIQARLHRLNSNDPKAHRDEVEQRCEDITGVNKCYLSINLKFNKLYKKFHIFKENLNMWLFLYVAMQF